MAQYQPTLQRALDALGRSDYRSALGLCDEALNIDPLGFDAAHLKGFCFAQMGRHNEAMKSYLAAAEIRPDFAPLLNNISASAIQLGDHANALVYAQRAVSEMPGFGPALNNAALAQAGLGRHGEALATWKKAEELPDCPATVFRNQVKSLILLRRAAEAVDVAIRGVAVEGRNAVTLTALAMAYVSNEDYWEALRAAQEALEQAPSNDQAKRHLGAALLALGDVVAASPVISELYEKYPSDPDVANSLGVLLQGQGDWDGAIQSFRRATELDPDFKRAHINLLFALRDTGRLDEAREYVGRWNPGHEWPAEGHHFGLYCLSIGLWELGWEWCERRRVGQDRPKLSSTHEAVSNLADVAGKKVLLYAEQGLGDTIMFARFAEALVPSCKEVVLEAPAPLQKLLSSLPNVRVVEADERSPDTEVVLPLMSVPWLIGAQPESIPVPTPYIFSDPQKRALWSERIGKHGFRIGISWQGNPDGTIDLGRSFPVRMFAGIGRIPGVRLISLQKNAGVEQLSFLPAGLNIETLGQDFDAGDQAFLDSAAVIDCVDLVITSDTAIAHLAGAMGRPVWIALKHIPDWRWLVDRTDSPFYPSARLFRQANPSDWKSVFDEMSKEVAEIAGCKWLESYEAPDFPEPATKFVRLAAKLLHADRYQEAVDVCQAALKNNYSDPDLSIALGLSFSKAARHEAAEKEFQKVVKAQPEQLEVRLHCARSLLALKRYQDASDVLDQNPSHIPVNADWHDSKAIALAGLERAAEAVAHWGTAIGLAPMQASFHHNRGVFLARQKRFSEALSSFRRAAALEPTNESAVAEVVRCHLALKQIDEAIEFGSSAFERFPSSRKVKAALAWAYLESGQIQSAETLCLSDFDETEEAYMLLAEINERKSSWHGLLECCDRITRINPENANAHALKGLALLKLGSTALALECAKRAQGLAPNDVKILNQLSIACQNNGDLEGAQQALERATAIDPTDQDTTWNLALHYLSAGDFGRGLPLYEVRKKRPQSAGMRVPEGKEAELLLDVLGRRVFLYTEQGLGDTIQFARYAEVLAKRAASVQLEVPPSLISLLGGLRGVKVLPRGGAASDFDCHLALMSAPRLMGARVETIPNEVPYIYAEPDRISKWAKRVHSKGFKIGIAWQGTPHVAVDEGRSFPVRLFEPISRIPGVRLISLQKNFGVEQLASLPTGMRVETLGADFDAGDQAFLDTAAVIANLDLVITSDTAVAHLAGAMGAPVWIALKFAPDWRWLVGRSDSPWYPTARLFRQLQSGNWESVFEEIAEAVRAEIRR